MDINNLNKKELQDLKSDIDKQLQKIDDQLKSDVEKLQSRSSLADLNNNDKIFCIHYHNEKIIEMEFVYINFFKNKKYNYMNFSTSHDTLPLGCNSALEYDEMKNHCFLSVFSSNSIYFFTLKPKNWQEDIKTELKRYIKKNRKNFNNEISELKNDVNSIFKNKKEVDEKIEKINIDINTKKYNL